MKPDIPESWYKVYFDIAFAMSKKSKDPSTKAGAVLVGMGNIILSTGYNGPPPGINDDSVPWDKRPHKYAYIIHAEENALLTALDSHGRREIEGASIYCTHIPCAGCMLRLIRSNVRYVFVPDNYKDYPLTDYEPVGFREIMSAQKLSKSDIQIRLCKYENDKQVPRISEGSNQPGDATT